MAPDVTSESRVRFRFEGDYSMVGDDNTDYFAAIVYNTLLTDSYVSVVTLDDFDLYEGKCSYM